MYFMKICFFGSSLISLNFIFLYIEKIFFLLIILPYDKFYRNKFIINTIKLYCKNKYILFFQYSFFYIYNNLNIYNYYFFKKIKKLNFKNILICDYSFLILLKYFNKYNIFNVHLAMLPFWRGPSPICFSYIFNNYFSLTLILINKFYDKGNILYFKKNFINFYFNHFVLYKNLFILFIPFIKFIIKKNLKFFLIQQDLKKIFCKKKFFKILL